MLKKRLADDDGVAEVKNYYEGSLGEALIAKFAFVVYLNKYDEDIQKVKNVFEEITGVKLEIRTDLNPWEIEVTESNIPRAKHDILNSDIGNYLFNPECILRMY